MVRDRRWRSPLLVLASLALAGGCEDAATEIVVVADSDLVAGSELTAIEASAAGSSFTFDLDDAGDLPLSFGVVPGSGQPKDAEVNIELIGRGPGGEPLIQSAVVTTFRPGERVVLPLPLARACSSVECAARETCRDGACVSNAVDSATLEEGDGSGVRLFDGPSTPDAGVADAGPPCEPGAACEEAQGCSIGTVSCSPEPACVDLMPAPAGTDCGGGRRCDGEGLCGR